MECKCYICTGEIDTIPQNMLQGHNILEAIKQAKRRQRGKKTTISMSRQRLMRILNGKSKATIQELELICAAYGLSIVAVNADEMSKIEQILAILCEK